MTLTLRRLYLTSFCIFSILGILHTELNLDHYENLTEETESVMIVPKAEAIRPLLIGLDSFMSDLIWIRTLGYFADQVLSHKKLTYFEDLLNLATDLDPRFERIYIWAGAAFMYYGVISKEKIMASTRFLEKGWKTIQDDPVGWKHDPEYWRIPQMIGFNYAIELRDREKGAPYIAIVAKIPGSPSLYKTWAATLYKRAGEWEKGTEVLENMLAIETLQSQLENVEEEDVKEQIRFRLDMYYKRLYGAQGPERLKLFKAKLKLLSQEWKESMPWMPFQFFALNRLTESEKMEGEESWQLFQSLFPILSIPK